jgi:hypothetical protein
MKVADAKGFEPPHDPSKPRRAPLGGIPYPSGTDAGLQAFAAAVLRYREAPSEELRAVCEAAAFVLRAARKVG